MGLFCLLSNLLFVSCNKVLTTMTEAASRPVVTIFQHDNAEEKVDTVPMPTVFVAPIRPDLVQTVHTNVAKNKRQAYAVSKMAGHQTSAESWGTGRAVSRIPRVAGGGTSRAGQGAFGNMCRGGRMFAPTKTWRKWHRKSNLTERRHAVASSLAASALPSLVMARGHKVDNVPEFPLVVSNGIENLQKTSEAVALLKRFGAHDDIDRVKGSKKLRRGKGKLRNRRHTQRRGPLIVYNENNGLVKAFRNIPGVELASVERLNLLDLAPGGHMGRFIIFTQGAFSALDNTFGTYSEDSAQKKGYRLPRPIMTNSDLTRIINSEEVQSVLREKKTTAKYNKRKRNPLKNLGAMLKLNPHAKQVRRQAIIGAQKAIEKKSANAEKRQKNKVKPNAAARGRNTARSLQKGASWQ